MKNAGMKLMALMVALMMLLSIAPALAEAPADGTPFDRILKSGKNLKTEVSFQLNPQVGSLIASFSGQVPDAEVMKVFQLLSDAVGKLKATLIASADTASGAIGTDKGDLLDYQISFSQDGADLKMATSLLPGLYMTVDPEIMAKFTKQASAQNMIGEKLAKIAPPYRDALTEEVAKIQQAAGSEEGSFETTYGVFSKRTEVTLTSHMLAGLLVKLGEVYAKDAELQALVKDIAASIMTTDMDSGEGTQAPAPEEYKDPILSMTESAQEALGNEDAPLLNLVAYESENAVYLDLATLPENPQPMNIQLHFGKDAAATKVELKILVDGYKYYAEDETPTPTDWVALEQGILTGAVPTATLVGMKIDAVNENDSKTESVLQLHFASSGISAKISANVAADLAAMESDSEFAFYLMGTEPLLKVAVHTAPTDEKPAAPAVEGMKELVLKEKMSEEDDALLEQATAGIGEALLEKLSMVLPDEAPAIIEMIKSMTAGSDIPEPSVDMEENAVEMEDQAESSSEAEGD